jgi:hypothetical protein
VSGLLVFWLERDIAAGNELGDVTTFRDPSVVDSLKQQLGD